MSYSVFRLHALFSVLERPLVCQLFNLSSWYCITKGKMKWDRKIVYILANTLYIYSRIEHILERNDILYFKLSKSGMAFYYIFRNETLQYSCTDKYQFSEACRLQCLQTILRSISEIFWTVWLVTLRLMLKSLQYNKYFHRLEGPISFFTIIVRYCNANWYLHWIKMCDTKHLHVLGYF